MTFSLVFLCSGDTIPYVEYTETEINTWRTIYNGLIKQHKKWACSEYLRNFSQLEEKGLYSPDVIPQLQDVSDHLKRKIFDSYIGLQIAVKAFSGINPYNRLDQDMHGEL